MRTWQPRCPNKDILSRGDHWKDSRKSNCPHKDRSVRRWSLRGQLKTQMSSEGQSSVRILSSLGQMSSLRQWSIKSLFMLGHFAIKMSTAVLTAVVHNSNDSSLRSGAGPRLDTSQPVHPQHKCPQKDSGWSGDQSVCWVFVCWNASPGKPSLPYSLSNHSEPVY